MKSFCLLFSLSWTWLDFVWTLCIKNTFKVEMEGRWGELGRTFPYFLNADWYFEVLGKKRSKDRLTKCTTKRKKANRRAKPPKTPQSKHLPPAALFSSCALFSSHWSLTFFFSPMKGKQVVIHGWHIPYYNNAVFSSRDSISIKWIWQF